MSPEYRLYNQVGRDALALHPRDMRRELRCTPGHTNTVARTMVPTHPMMTLNEPNGVTNIGGAKEYAAKFATEVRTCI